jgi:Flp pilus assembly protein TadG
MRRLAARSGRGQIVVLVSLVLPVLLGAIALGTDVAIFYFNWAQLQKAADAAVIAGANYLPSNPSLAQQTTDQYAEMNGIASSEIVATTVASDNLSIQIQAKRTVPYYFARVLGLSTGAVAVKATAGLQASNSASGLVPIGLQYNTPLTTYQTVTLKLAPAQGSVGPGNWEPLAMGYTPNADPGGANYKANLENGYDSTINIGDQIYTETGNLVGPTQQGINYRLSQGSTTDSGGTATNHTLNDPRVIEIPLVNFSDINGSSQVPVMGFAELWISSVDGAGNITAEFINQVSAQNTPSSSAPQYGAFSVVLMQ